MSLKTKLSIFKLSVYTSHIQVYYSHIYSDHGLGLPHIKGLCPLVVYHVKLGRVLQKNILNEGEKTNNQSKCTYIRLTKLDDRKEM